ncbi:MAG: hypothetical protein BWY76_02187 [bacterium ADurb.Bin429]|nr:MAG: hypothetical protein BWY76_02187 [bacterium ADurb.Bin429]
MSTQLGARIFAVVAEGISGSYGFRLFAGGSLVRDFMSVDGKVETNAGTPLPEETGFDYESPFEDDVFNLMQRISVDVGDLDVPFLIKTFGDDAMASALSAPMSKPQSTKPWWKFW